MRRSSMKALWVGTLVVALAPAMARAEDVPTAGEATSTSSGEETSAVRRPHALMDASPQTRHQMLSFFAELPYYYAYGVGVGAGARYTLPIVPDGFIPKLNDSVELEFGVDLSYVLLGAGYIGIGIPAEARWTFHITDKFDAYGKVAVGWVFGVGAYVGPTVGYPYFSTGLGVLYKLTDSLSLRGEIMSGGLKGGIGFDL